MARPPPASEPAFEDLTARARIRQAALAQFTEHGYERTTIRGVAAAAGVSPGLVRHHFGSKQGLRDAIDAHVMIEVLRLNDELKEDSERGDLRRTILSREEVRPYQGYLLRALMEGSPTMAMLFDSMISLSEEWVVLADQRRTDEPFTDTRTRAVVLTALGLAVPLLHEHISRALGVDTLSDEGDRLVAMALLDIYSHTLITPELAALARAGFEDTTLRSAQ
jgi:AcrR family transcriptional regulator